MVLVLGAGCCFVKGYVVEHLLHFRLLAKLSQVRMFSFVSKRLSLMMMMKVCCLQRNFSSALPPLVPVKLPSKMYEQQYLYLVFATFFLVLLLYCRFMLLKIFFFQQFLFMGYRKVFVLGVVCMLFIGIICV